MTKNDCTDVNILTSLSKVFGSYRTPNVACICTAQFIQCGLCSISILMIEMASRRSEERSVVTYLVSRTHVFESYTTNCVNWISVAGNQCSVFPNSILMLEIVR